MNYPDNIRSFDHDPRSPFYNGPDAQDYRDQAQEMLDADNESNEALEVLFESDAFMTQLKHLLSLGAHEVDLPITQAVVIAEAANGLILEAEDYLAKWLEMTS